MQDLLRGKRGLLFGAIDEQSLAWHVAERCVACGAKLVMTNTETAARLGNVLTLCREKNLPFVACDATDVEQLATLLNQAQELLGGKIDFVLHAVAQSENIRRHRDYEDANYTYFQRTIDVSALSLHKLLHVAREKDAIAEGGSVVTLSYLASERYMHGYNDMADAKAMLESIVRQMGAVYGREKGVRVNAVSQSATPTKAGGAWSELEYFYRYTDQLSPLGNADANACADLCVALFSDLTRMVTMQTIYNDGGFGRTILTPELMDSYRKME